jgi:arylsulfatase A-like enzyme
VPGLAKQGGKCTKPVDFMSIYPTLCDLAGLPIPAHLEGKSIRSLLADPTSEWKGHALTTFKQNNHAIRTDRWRYIRYHDGGEELYDHSNDPYEWTNLAAKPEHAALKLELAKNLPSKNVAPVPGGNKAESSEGDAGARKEKQKLRKKKAAETAPATSP